MIKKELNWNRVAVVLVNYNGEEVLTDCVKSLVDNSEDDLEIIIVDNGSEDAAMEDVESRYPYVHTIYMGENAGWGAGCNIGMQTAFENGAGYVLLLNTDTEIEEGMISELLKYCNDNTLTIPRIYRDKNDKDRSLWYSGGKIDYEAADARQTLYTYDAADGSRNEPRKVEFATGCCMMISRGSWEKVGGFDEEYFLYYEDVDYCMRLKEQEIEILYVPKAALWHKVGGSAGGEISYISQYYTVRNRLFFADKYKKYLKTDVMGILKRIIEERTYFTTPFDKKYERVVLAGVKDYMKGVRGQEKNFMHENYTVINGFYEMELDEGGGKWLWSGENEAEIELHNFGTDKKIYEIKGKMHLPEGVKRDIVNVYCGQEYDCSIDVMLNNFCFQRVLEAGEKVRIKFRLEKEQEDVDESSRSRRLVFGIGDLKVETKTFKGYVLGSGTYETERENGNSWNWISNKNFHIRLINEQEKEREGVLRFTLLPAPTREDVCVVLTEGESCPLGKCRAGQYQFQMRFAPCEEKLIQFYAEEEPVEGFNGDPRRFFYGISNIHFEIG